MRSDRPRSGRLQRNMEKAPPSRHTPQRDDDVVVSPLDANQRRVRSRFTLSRTKKIKRPSQSDFTADRRAIIVRGFLSLSLPLSRQKQLEIYLQRNRFYRKFNDQYDSPCLWCRICVCMCVRTLFAENYPAPNVIRAALMQTVMRSRENVHRWNTRCYIRICM